MKSSFKIGDIHKVFAKLVSCCSRVNPLIRQKKNSEKKIIKQSMFRNCDVNIIMVCVWISISNRKYF